MWFSMSGFTSPGTVYRYDFEEGEGRTVGVENVYREAKVEGIKPEEFESSQVFYESKDGTKVPMFITRPKG
jgi:prolyl oligopeptidase